MNLRPSLFSYMRRRRIALLALVLFGLSAGFGLLAFYSPVKSLPALATCSLKMTAASCQYVLAQSKVQIAAAQVPLWLYQSEAEVAMGFAVVAMLSLLRLPRWSLLDRPLALRFSKRVLFVLAVVGASVFVFLVLIDATYEILPFSRSFDNLFGFKTVQAQGSSYGVVAFIVWGLTVLSLSLHRGLMDALKVFGFPAILFLTVALLVFDPSVMTGHATNFATWSVGSIDIVSNWLVFMVSSFILLVGRVKRF